jgi:hypothetical protein
VFHRTGRKHGTSLLHTHKNQGYGIPAVHRQEDFPLEEEKKEHEGYQHGPSCATLCSSRLTGVGVARGDVYNNPFVLSQELNGIAMLAYYKHASLA